MTEAKTPTGEAETQRARERIERDREREHEWDRQPFPKSRERERDANERTYWRAVAEIPNPGPVEPLTELQAFHAEQTDPPPGPYPDPPLGPYPDPVIKERPSEEAIYGRKRQGTEDRPRSPRRAGSEGKGGREYDEPNFDGYDEDVRERAEGVPSAAAPERQSADVRKPSNARSSNVSRAAANEHQTRGEYDERKPGDREAGREPRAGNGGHAGRSEADRPADQPGKR